MLTPLKNGFKAIRHKVAKLLLNFKSPLISQSDQDFSLRTWYAPVSERHHRGRKDRIERGEKTGGGKKMFCVLVSLGATCFLYVPVEKREDVCEGVEMERER